MGRDVKEGGNWHACPLTIQTLESPYSDALPGPFDLSLTVGHPEAHARHAGMFLNPVRQRLRMRGNPELGMCRGANDQVRQGIQNIRVQARLRFVDRQE